MEPTDKRFMRQNTCRYAPKQVSGQKLTSDVQK